MDATKRGVRLPPTLQLGHDDSGGLRITTKPGGGGQHRQMLMPGRFPDVLQAPRPSPLVDAESRLCRRGAQPGLRVHEPIRVVPHVVSLDAENLDPALRERLDSVRQTSERSSGRSLRWPEEWRGKRTTLGAPLPGSSQPFLLDRGDQLHPGILGPVDDLARAHGRKAVDVPAETQSPDGRRRGSARPDWALVCASRVASVVLNNDSTAMGMSDPVLMASTNAPIWVA